MTPKQGMNQRLGKYTIKNKIGSGGYGTVYRATDNIGRTVAIKVLKPDLASEPDAIERFRREALAAGSLFHSQIATIIDFDESDGHVFLVMRFIDGMSLDQIIKESGRFHWDEALVYLRQIADGLEFAHSKGFLHRDIKPSNIIISPIEGAVLTDFGLVKAATASGLSTTGVILGTPPYIAPEIWSGKEVTPATDVYSLACVSYEMITGRVLFDGKSTPEVMKKHFDPILLPDQWPDDIPEGITEILYNALETESDQRYRDISSFITSLEKLNKPENNRTTDHKELIITSNDMQSYKLKENQPIQIHPDQPPSILEKTNPPLPLVGKYNQSSIKKNTKWRFVVPLIILLILLLCFLLPWVLIEVTNSYCALFPGIFNAIQPGACP